MVRKGWIYKFFSAEEPSFKQPWERQRKLKDPWPSKEGQAKDTPEGSKRHSIRRSFLNQIWLKFTTVHNKHRRKYGGKLRAQVQDIRLGWTMRSIIWSGFQARNWTRNRKKKLLTQPRRLGVGHLRLLAVTALTLQPWEAQVPHLKWAREKVEMMKRSLMSFLKWGTALLHLIVDLIKDHQVRVLNIGNVLLIK